MKRLIIALTVVLFTSGLSYGQDRQGEPGPNFEHLKNYRPMIGTWRYEGPLHEDLVGMATKGTKLVFEFTWRRILNKNVVEENWSLEFEGGKKLSGKALIGWNAAEKRLVYGGMNSIGGIELGTIVFDREAKTSTLTSKGIDADGKQSSFEGVVTKTGANTLTWQAAHQQGSLVEGPSAVYEFNRVKRTRKNREPKQAN